MQCEVWLITRVYCLTFLLGLSECVWQTLHAVLGGELQHLLDQVGRGNDGRVMYKQEEELQEGKKEWKEWERRGKGGW